MARALVRLDGVSRIEDRTVAWPDLANTDGRGTMRSLHMWTQIVGKIRMSTGSALNHWWHVPLYVSARGLTTSLVQHPVLPFEITFDFRGRQVLVEAVTGERRHVDLYPRSVADFYAELTHTLTRLGIEVNIIPRPVEVQVAIPFPEDTAPGEYDAEYAIDLWAALVHSHRALLEVSSGFNRKNSPVHFFWGSFDLAQTRFSGRPAPTHPGGVPNCPDWVMREAYSHQLSSCGYWPGGDSGGTFYAYAYPEPPDFGDASIAGGRYDVRLGEFVMSWESVRTAPDPHRMLVDFFKSASAAATELGKWDRAAQDYSGASFPVRRAWNAR